MAEESDPNDPRNQAASQIGIKDAGPGEPGHYTPPNPNAGITRSVSNEVKPGPAEGKADDYDYESHTVPELREMADSRGIQIESGARKDEIIEALKKG